MAHNEVAQPPQSKRVFALLRCCVACVPRCLTTALLVERGGSSVFGAKGAVIAAGAAGLADAHGGALSAVTLFSRGDLSLNATLIAIGAALVVNSIVKGILVFVTGRARFGRRFLWGIVPSLAVFVVALALLIHVD